MLKLKDIMTHSVLTLRSGESLRDAIELLSGNHISGAPVLEHGMLVGVVSSIDVMDALAAWQQAEERGAKAWAGDGDDTSDAETETASWFTTWDDADDTTLESAAEHGDALDELTVADAMTRSLAELPPDTEIHEAAAYMLERGIHRVLVVEDGRLEGLVSTTDFLRVIAEKKL